jgi:hypothetical protein
MTKILKQNHLSSKLEEVRKEMNSQVAGTITKDLGEHTMGTEVQAQRILSDDSLHFILIKGLSNKRKLEEVNRIQEETEMMEEYKEESQGQGQNERQGRNESRIKDEKDELVESDTEVSACVRESKQIVETEHLEVKSDQLQVKYNLEEESNSYESSDKERIPIIKISDSDQENNPVNKVNSNRDADDRKVVSVEDAVDSSSSREITLTEEASNHVDRRMEKAATVESIRSHSSEEKEKRSYQSESSDSEGE